MITKNVGKIDRVIRMIAGVALAAGAYLTGGPAALILGLAGLVAFLTGLLGWCGLYRLFGINTCSVDKP